jgi:hypothetical protein
MTNGLRRISFRRAFHLVSAFSRGAYHLSSPVSLRRRFALVTRIMGAYVSGTVKMMMTRQTPAWKRQRNLINWQRPFALPSPGTLTHRIWSRSRTPIANPGQVSAVATAFRWNSKWKGE